MADFHRVGVGERDVDQAITALKKGAYLLKYGRMGKPKFCPFRLSTDESSLIWYYGKEEKQLELRYVSKIIPGQRTSIFQRYPRPEKEYQSFSLIYNDRSLDLICKDKDEAEVWFVGLKALIARGSTQKVRTDGRADSVSSDSPRSRKVSPSIGSFDQGENQRSESIPQSRLGKAFADIVSYTATTKTLTHAESFTHSVSSLSSGVGDNPNGRSSTADTVRVSLSSAVSSSSQGSCHDDFDSLGDVFIWGESTGGGLLGGGVIRVRTSSSTKVDALLPRALESTAVLDALGLACGSRHAALVTKQKEVFTWGEESGGRLGHGVGADVSHPKLVDTLTGLNIEMVACGEYHTCAVTLSGDLYTWGDGIYNCGLLGHGSEASHWIPKKVSGLLDSLQVSYVSCGLWHTALITSAGQLFTFGDGSFGVLGHGDQSRSSVPREVDAFKGLRTLRVACGVWHTAAVVEVIMTKSSDSQSSDVSISGNLFTWGNGDKGRLGHGDKENRLVPEGVAAVVDLNFCQVSCGDNLTVALTTTGRVYTMGSTAYGQLGSPSATGNIPTCVESNIADSVVEEIACGSHHVAVMTSKTEVYTWGKGGHGQLGHGDNDNRHTPTRVDFLKDKQVKNVVCGSNLTAVICVNKGVSSADNSICYGCQNPFNFRRKRHNCYNCGLVFCQACSSRRSLKASLAPTTSKPYRVCDDCFTKLQKAMESGSGARAPKGRSGNIFFKPNELGEKETGFLQGQYHRVSSVDSLNPSEGRSSLYSSKLDLNDRRIFPLSNENLKKGISPLSKTPTTLGTSGNFLSIFVPSSRMPSRTTSPISGKPSSPLSARSTLSPTVRVSEKVIDDMKLKNESLTQEVTSLRAQVEDLASKYRQLEDELDKKSRKLKEATAVAADEAEKCEAAKEVILSLSEQLKDMAERLTEGQSTSTSTRNGSNAEQVLNDTNHYSSTSSVNNYQACPKGGPTANSSNSNSPKGTKAQTEKSEWVVQEEPGVYVTLTALPGGGNELKRVRFSRKRFTEQQAEKWWAEHGSRVCEKHKVQDTE